MGISCVPDLWTLSEKNRYCVGGLSEKRNARRTVFGICRCRSDTESVQGGGGLSTCFGSKGEESGRGKRHERR